MTKQPSYRFVGYIEPWEEKKFQELSTKKGKKNTNGESYPVYSVSNQSGLIPQSEQFEGSRLDNLDKKSYKIVEPNEFAYNPARINVGSIAFNNLNHRVIVSSLYVIFILDKKIDNSFAIQFIKSDKFIKEVKRNTEGSVREYLFYENFSNIRLPYPPSLPEQTAIGSFFQDIDQLISLQQRKLEVLREQKKTYLKLLFPAKGQTKPALRFAGFEDDWKEVKLGEVLKKNNKKNRDLAINNVESVSNKLGFVKQTEQFEDYSVASADLSNYYVISEKQFAYNPSRINVGSIAYKKEGDTLSVVSPLYISFSTVENIDDSYLWYWFKTSLFDSQREIYSEGGVRDTLSFNQLSNIELIFPFLPEQEAIGSFFQDLDKSIAKQEEKVNQLKESKQTLLRKMFI